MNDDDHVMCTHKDASTYGEIVSAKHKCKLYEPNAECFIASVMNKEKYTSGKSEYTQKQI